MQIVPQSELWTDAAVMLDLLVFVFRFGSAEIARSRAFNSVVCIDWDQSPLVFLVRHHVAALASLFGTAGPRFYCMAGKPWMFGEHRHFC